MPRPIAWDPARHRTAHGDPFSYYARLRRESPVIRARIPTRGVGWVVTRYDDVAAVLKDARFSADPRHSASPPLFGFGGSLAPKLIRLVGDSMICVDDPAHARLRKLVAKAFTPRTVDEMEEPVARTVDALLDRLSAAAEGGAAIDLMACFALPLPLDVISDMLGIPAEMRLSFHHQIVRLIEVNDRPVKRAVRWAPAMPRLVRFFETLVELRRREPDGKLISRLIEAEDAGDHLSRDELVAMIFLLLFAGHETSVNLIGNGVLALLDDPEQLALLRARPELMEGAVEELLRFTSPVEFGTMRFAREPVDIGGVTIRPGEMVMALHASANRDESAFPEPDRLDVTRSPGRHLAFGAGLHYCIGAALGRMEARLALAALLARFPGIALAAPRESLRWRQSSGLRGLTALPLRLCR